MCKRKKSDVGKIFETTDGIFNGRDDIRKPRPVAVVDQRKDDGAVALVKIHSNKEKKGNVNVPDLILNPIDHPSLTEESVVEKNVRLGKKVQGTFIPILPRDLTDKNDSLSPAELKIVMQSIKGSDKDKRKKHKKKMKKWHKHFGK